MKIKPHLNKYRRDSYVSNGNSIRRAYQITPEDEIDCDLGTSPFGQSPQVARAIKRFDFEQSVHYSSPFHEDIKEVILARFRDANLRPENIFFGHGSFNLAERIIHKVIQPTAMLGYGPQFNEIPTEMVIAGGIYVPIPMDPTRFILPEREMITELGRRNYSLVYIDNPNNPTGQCTPLSSLERIVSAADREGTLVLVDEAYGDFVDDSESAFNLVHNHRNLMVIRSLSKGMGLGSFRFGYAAFSSELAGVYKEIDVPFEPSGICAVAGKAALEDSDFIHGVRKKSREAKAVLTQGLSKLGLKILPTHPNVSIFTANLPGEDVVDLFAKHGVITETGESYRLVYPRFDNSFVRIRIPKGNSKMTPYELSQEVVDRLSKQND